MVTSTLIYDTLQVSLPLCYMYFTIAYRGCSIKSERGITPQEQGGAHIKGGGIYVKEDNGVYRRVLRRVFTLGEMVILAA